MNSWILLILYIERRERQGVKVKDRILKERTMNQVNTDSKESETGTVREAAAFLGIGLNQAYEACHAGTIPAVRIGGRWIVSLVALRRKVESGGQPLPNGVEAA